MVRIGIGAKAIIQDVLSMLQPTAGTTTITLIPLDLWFDLLLKHSTIIIITIITTLSIAVLALANIEVDLSTVAEGTTVTVSWRGKPLFIKHRYLLHSIIYLFIYIYI